MKIGILAYHSACNFGANLQVLSTVGYLRNNGHEPVVINYEADDFVSYYKRVTPSDVFEAYKIFRNEHMPLSAYCRTQKDIARVIESEGIEAVIVGSDAVAQHHTLFERIVFPTRRVFHVQRMTSDRYFGSPFWGGFRDDLSNVVPMALLSASNQDSNFRYFSSSLKKRMHECLKHFTYISARDEWTKKMYGVISKGEIDVPVTPDPVFAFNHNCEDIIPSKETILEKYSLPEKYVLVSFLNSRAVSQAWLDDFENALNARGVAAVALPFPQGMCFEHNLVCEIESPLLPLDWYALIKYSYGYVGHNMHPIVVSLHNAVPFFSFDNYGMSKLSGWITDDSSSKIKHILGLAGLESNRVSCLSRNFVAPSPNVVLDALEGMSKEKAENFSTDYYAEYGKMMSEILMSFGI